MSEHTGVGECLEAHMAEVAEEWLRVYRKRRWRQGNPLLRRRVRRRIDGREGVIVNAIYTCSQGLEQVRIAIDWDERLEGEKRWQMGNENILFCEILEPPPLQDGTVRVRTVLLRGTKDQVTQRWAELPALSDERLAAGERRYVEFDDQPMAYRRWRIVHISAPLTAEKVTGIPSEAPRAAALRRDAESYADDRREVEQDWAA